jgi:energy-coupling factor transport system ATP-binding protein
MAQIEIEDFSFTYPGSSQPILKQLSLSIETGAFVVLTGMSGSGKSTLGKALAGFLFADDSPQFTGKILVNGTDMTKVPLLAASERVAYVQQNPEDQFCTLTVQDEIAFGLENACTQPSKINEQIDWALSVVKGRHLKASKLHELSGGEKQKIAIASMLALSPDVLILDEPTSNLDPIATGSIFETLHSIRLIHNMTVIIIEHKLSQLLNLNPQIFTLEQGRVLTDGKPSVNENQNVPDLLTTLIQQSGLSSANPIAKTTELSVQRGGKDVLNSINLQLSPGQFIALMGPNGSGKSTLLQTLMGFHPIKSGKVKVLNHDLDNLKVSKLVPDIGFIFQNPDHQLFSQSVLGEATLTSKNLGQLTTAIKQTGKRWLAEIGLGDRLEDHPHRLSYGEKRRLNLVAAILHEPKLLLIDEFLIGQDMINANRWMKFLKTFTKNGNSILMVIHHPKLTMNYCDRLIFLDAGKVVIDAPTETAFATLAQSNYSAFLPEQDWFPLYA